MAPASGREGGNFSSPALSPFDHLCLLKGCLLRFEPQLLSYRLPVKVYVLKADLITKRDGFFNFGSLRRVAAAEDHGVTISGYQS